MPPKKSYITVTDQFCGAGGSSQGAVQCGAEIKLALNHWSLAIETHQNNFPDTIHECTDISACDPRRYPSTDILITSPECTNHSLAKGKKTLKAQLDMFAKGILDPAAERSRATMWDVPRFAEYHHYSAIVVENVVDARKWIMFDAWLMAMHALGYKHECVYLNSMFCHPTPQSRDRMYVVFWKKTMRKPNLNITPLAWCNKCSIDVNAVQSFKPGQISFKYKTGYVYCCPNCSAQVQPYYHAAFNIIDWTDLGTRIGDRNKPLSPNTIKRIEYGLKKYGAQPSVITQKYHSETGASSSKNIFDALRCQPTEQAHGILSPFVVDDKQTTGVDFRVRGVMDKLSTVHTSPNVKVVFPFIIKGEHTLQTGYAKSVNEPVQTQSTRQTMAIITPFIAELKKTSKARSSNSPLSAVTTVPYHGIVSSEAWKSFITSYYRTPQASHISDAVNAVNTRERHWLVSNATPKIEDCYYRMLKPHEIQLAMAFEPDYKISGSGKDKVKQLGNAVTPPAMKTLIQKIMQIL